MQMKQLVYFLENAILNLPADQEQMIWLIDFKGWSMKKSSPVSVARETANILQNHYPERLFVAILYNPPRLFEAFWTVSCKLSKQNAYNLFAVEIIPSTIVLRK
jgi:hypothetical protein